VSFTQPRSTTSLITGEPVEKSFLKGPWLGKSHFVDRDFVAFWPEQTQHPASFSTNLLAIHGRASI
jgi:hypothetical protein